MTFAEDSTLRAALRKPFPPEQIGSLPKPTKKNAEKGRCPDCGKWHGLPAVHLSYVGHAIVTDRLNNEAPDWSFTIDKFIENGGHLEAIVGTMTIGGKSIPETGDAEPSENSTYADETKRAISDFIRRGAMRFGVAIDLWSKEDMKPEQTAGGQVGQATGEGVGQPDRSVTQSEAQTEPNQAHEHNWKTWPNEKGRTCQVEGCGVRETFAGSPA